VLHSAWDVVFVEASSEEVDRVPHPLRSLQRVGYARVGIEILGIPPFAKGAKDGAPGNYCGLIKIARCGFPWKKTTKRPIVPVYTNCETALALHSGRAKL
jgi:hypothetical protein